jgi:glycosyltransferase involved in cell wall biosynthesis
VVIKDWKDRLVDDELERRGVRVISQDIPGIGAALARGLAECTGESVSFLDDDDQFARGKIPAVREAFERDPELTVFRNGWTAVDPSGRTADTYNHAVRQPKEPREFRVGEMDDATLRWILDNRAYGNLSTLSVRRRYLAARASDLGRIECGIDVGVPILLMEGSQKHAFDPRPLTIRRIGSSLRRGLTSGESRAYTRTFQRLRRASVSTTARRYAEMNVRWGRLDSTIGTLRLAVIEKWMGRVRAPRALGGRSFLRESMIAACRFAYPAAAAKLLGPDDPRSR